MPREKEEDSARVERTPCLRCTEQVPAGTIGTCRTIGARCCQAPSGAPLKSHALPYPLNRKIRGPMAHHAWSNTCSTAAIKGAPAFLAAPSDVRVPGSRRAVPVVPRLSFTPAMSGTWPVYPAYSVLIDQQVLKRGPRFDQFGQPTRSPAHAVPGQLPVIRMSVFRRAR